MTHTPRDDDRGGPISHDHTAAPYAATEFAPVEDPFRAPAASGSSAGDSADRWPTDSPEASAGTADVAQGEAAQVKDTAVDAGKNVAATAKDEAANVVADTKAQAKNLLGSVTNEVRDQAGSQQQKIAASVQSLSQELTGMASGSAESGPLTDLAHQAAQKGGEISRWLEDREPRDVLDEVTSFARRKPVTFLALCGLAGVVAGRLTRGAVATNTSIDSPSTSRRAVETGPSAEGVETGRSVQELPATPLYDEVLTSNPDLAGPGSEYQGDRSGGMR